MANLTISSTVKNRPRTTKFADIATTILGARYELSLAFVGSTRAASLNEAYRGKDYVPNVLSFPLAKDTGEIFICPEVAKREAKNFDLSVSGYITFLFIHGCLHLKGYDHGATMDRLERKYCNAFSVS